MRKHILLYGGLATACICVVLAIIFWPNENIAKSEAERVLKDFGKQSLTKLYCQNGYPPNFSNKLSWWDMIYAGDGDPSRTAHVTETILREAGYVTTKKFVGTREAEHEKGKSYVEIKGSSGTISVAARISHKNITKHSCVNDAWINHAVNPKLSNAVVVFQFRSTREGY